MADDVTLGTRIRQLRKANGWTLADVAARTGLSVSFLSDIERGRTDPSLNTLDKIAAAHGLRVAITITKDGDTPMADDVTLLPLGGEGEALQASFEAYRNAVNACIADLKAQLAEAREWSSTLADAADDLRAELREAQQILAAMQAGTCVTCKHCEQWTTSDGEPRAACTRLSDDHKVIEFVMAERDFCSRWREKGDT